MKAKKLTKVQMLCLATLFTLTMSTLPSCEKNFYNRYGFDSDFGKNSFGLTIMSINSQVSSIRLSGDILMGSGEIKVEFIDPEGFIVYSRDFFAPGNYFVNETFKASRGIWKLRYTSIKGIGSIDLHADF